eukprot:8026121-Heterocapsa_arctica.AAC.1
MCVEHAMAFETTVFIWHDAEPGPVMCSSNIRDFCILMSFQACSKSTRMIPSGHRACKGLP